MNPSTETSFFPPVYQGGRLFFAHHLAAGRVAVAGSASQLPHAPFADPDRARHEEFGDTFVAGIFDSILRNIPMDQVDWRRVVAARRDLIVSTHAQLRNLSGPTGRAARYALAVAGSQRFTKTDFDESMRAWQLDGIDWERRIGALPHLGSITEAAEFLGLRLPAGDSDTLESDDVLAAEILPSDEPVSAEGEVVPELAPATAGWTDELVAAVGVGLVAAVVRHAVAPEVGVTASGETGSRVVDVTVRSGDEVTSIALCEGPEVLSDGVLNDDSALLSIRLPITGGAHEDYVTEVASWCAKLIPDSSNRTFPPVVAAMTTFLVEAREQRTGQLVVRFGKDPDGNLVCRASPE
ncbi:MAG: hypothetical protein J2P17_32320, partial [Mycobacterium sp.]|nr:hypothetical protein [Mycobacterium sp.]